MISSTTERSHTRLTEAVNLADKLDDELLEAIKVNKDLEKSDWEVCTLMLQKFNSLRKNIHDAIENQEKYCRDMEEYIAKEEASKDLSAESSKKFISRKFV